MTAKATGHLVLPLGVRRAIVAHARRDAPLECCGLLVGRKRVVAFAVACTNVERSEVRYRIQPREHVDVQRTLRAFSPPLEIVGVYHSHPRGRAIPSPTDIAEASYPDWAYVIVGLGPSRAEIAAYTIRAGHVHALRPARTPANR